MGSEVEEGEDLLIETHRQSLLELIEDRNRTLNKKSQIHRLVYITKLSEENLDRMEVGNHYEKQLKKLHDDYPGEPTTGLMLIYMKHIVNVLESSTELLLKVLKGVQKSVSDGKDGYETKAKLLLISHDVPNRLYQQWTFRCLDIEAIRLEAYEPSGSVEELVLDVLTQLLKLGSFLNSHPKPAWKSIMDQLRETVPEHLPQQAALHYLLAEDDQCMMSLSEFIDLYEKPFDVALESSMVWPIQTKLFPYN